MKNKHAVGESYRVDGTVCVALAVFDYFKHPSPSKTFERFRMFVFLSFLGERKRVAEVLDY